MSRSLKPGYTQTLEAHAERLELLGFRVQRFKRRVGFRVLLPERVESEKAGRKSNQVKGGVGKK